MRHRSVLALVSAVLALTVGPALGVARSQGSGPSAEERPPAPGEYIYFDQMPEAIQKIPPVYPQLARDAGVFGNVTVQALVGRDGLVKDTKVTKSIPLLDDAAIECVRQWRFRPALSEGKPISVWVSIPVRFNPGPTPAPGTGARIAPDGPRPRPTPPPVVGRRIAPDQYPTPVVIRRVFGAAVGFAIEPMGVFLGFLEDGVCWGVFRGHDGGGTFRAVRTTDGRYHAQGEYTQGRRGRFDGDWRFIDEIPEVRRTPEPAEHTVWPPGRSPDPRREPPPSFDHPIGPPEHVDDGPMPGTGDRIVLDTWPEPTRKTAPEYPAEARIRGIQGTVAVQALVDRNGVVREARVVNSIPALDAAALEAVRQWRFPPATSAGRPAAFWIVVPVKFLLH